MSEAGEARRARLGPEAVKAARDAAMSAPAPSPELLDRIALLLRTLRAPRRGSDAEHGDVA